MPKPTTAARVYLTLIGLMLAAMGGLFAWLMGASFGRAAAVDEWPQADAVIIHSEVARRQVDPNLPPEFRFEVFYAYEWDGEGYESDRYRLRGASWTKSRAAAEELVSRYGVGDVHPARVNPEAPDEAVLVGESRAPGYSIWFPLIFVVGGLGIVVGAWRRK
jgi:hypothetical protein